MKVLYYGRGGGHGHFLRGLAILGRLGTGTILGPSEMSELARAWGVSQLPGVDAPGIEPPDLLLVDVFPRGVQGELLGLLGRPVGRS